MIVRDEVVNNAWLDVNKIIDDRFSKLTQRHVVSGLVLYINKKRQNLQKMLLSVVFGGTFV